MKIIAKNKTEFDELVRTFKYLHDHPELDQDEYPMLGLIAHLYRVEYAAADGSHEEQKAIESIFYIEDK